MNGVNTPWDKWNDFGGSYNKEFWDNHFQKLSSNGINASRVWVSCNGLHIKIDTNGKVKGPTEQYWTDLDSFFAMAEKNGIYIMATLISFDNFKDEGQPYMSWRALLENEKNMDSYVENYVIPFAKRYSKFNSLWSIDYVMNLIGFMKMNCVDNYHGRKLVYYLLKVLLLFMKTVMFQLQSDLE